MPDPLETAIEVFLAAGRPAGWRSAAVEVMRRIPEGKLATYGQVARKLRQRHGYRIAPRTIGWLRGHLYGIYRANSITPSERSIPLHRVATKGDVASERDSPRTSRENDAMRAAEGFSIDSPWVRDSEW